MHQHPSHRRWIWLGVLFAVLAGVLGMHGLTSHGVAPTTHGHGSPVASHHGALRFSGTGHFGSDHTGDGATTTGTAAHRALAHAPAAGSMKAARSAPRDDDEPIGGGMQGMADLCLTVLLAGALSWALLTRARQGRGLLLRFWATTLVAPTASRDGAPPSLTVLCLRRC